MRGQTSILWLLTAVLVLLASAVPAAAGLTVQPGTTDNHGQDTNDEIVVPSGPNDDDGGDPDECGIYTIQDGSPDFGLQDRREREEGGQPVAQSAAWASLIARLGLWNLIR